MQINIIAIGTRMPEWVQTAVGEYDKRLRQDCQLNWQALAMVKRHKNQNINQIVQQESTLLLAATTSKHQRVALDQTGESFSTKMLAEKLRQLQQQGLNLDLLIGGPDGMSSECLAQMDQRWSLSKLTLPHPLVRVILVEQIYRAFSILKQHPYHRG